MPSEYWLLVHKQCPNKEEATHLQFFSKKFQLWNTEMQNATPSSFRRATRMFVLEETNGLADFYMI